ncbi:hypothetical protein CPAST_c01580 [Clostridium pasteurianum DSM 525 = ATCC 6013]|uniref:ABC-transporter type IV n=1 Tax=Clostridium pasteurianum DSM 525 = ATCC 6013 TaxID=1262449 RepID=A0A0H3J2W6_CLOPA|nr:putative ABC transporter permease [Clostridium pasteurianum]AJA46258.1 hypothetical protein CPAST_c01580 [Clostridium pasteurianum DSM 525 = ATCC 6013]AJA50246.1 hypothetical protein CLPA_c01580 [Clostridium pasteurianum DSM 525 = ATCC 6013]AOZ73711.1 hypothetical protein AQ983_00775 [Clostridium pasteurianum DSM 525 = ATCC 6013]AOZ77508.1 hypothetical protein AQ984_00775 [Clostridium pasteurianum]ELP60842.1 membrane protein [Clostridium pasteurianum DSM 525 = ATCC 6013]
MLYLLPFYAQFHHIFFYFLIYSFLGWCAEIIYAAKIKGEFVNRGFLNGPFCPVYGFGAISLLAISKSFQNNIIFLILLSLFLPSFVEYITGFILEKLFNTKWWDYSDTIFNLQGRICIKFSTIWFLVSLIILTFIQPYFIEPLVSFIPLNYGIIIMYALIVYFIVDLYITVLSLIKLKGLFIEIYNISLELKNKLNTIKQIGYSIRPMDIPAAPRNIKSKFTDVLENTSKSLSNKLEDINDILENTTYNISLKLSNKLSKEEIDIFNSISKKIKELKNNYNNLLNKIAYNHSRFFKAYPNLKSKYITKSLLDIQKKIKLINLKSKKKD